MQKYIMVFRHDMLTGINLKICLAQERREIWNS